MEQLSFTLEFRKPRRQPRADLTATRARDLLAYNPETGALTWKTSRPGHAQAGREAGHVDDASGGRTPYRKVRIDGVLYKAHRVCFLIYYGAWPPAEVDHIDHNGLNNRISNLRAVTKAINNRNQVRYSTNTSGVTGVYWNRVCSRWWAEINVAGRCIRLGKFDTLAEAACARKLAERRHGYHENHGRELRQEHEARSKAKAA